MEGIKSNDHTQDSADAINCHMRCHAVVTPQRGRRGQIWRSSPEHMDRREGIRALHEVAFPSRRRPRLFPMNGSCGVFAKRVRSACVLNCT